MSMILLPCHAVWTGGPLVGKLREEWLLAPFQIQGNDHLCFREHVEMGLREREKRDAVLVISGGKTKKETQLSEARSYLNLARAMGASDGILLEEYARDSFENVLFGLCRYHDEFGVYPKELVIVGFEFKRTRFTKHHLRTLEIENFTYIGNEPQGQPPEYYAELEKAEHEHAVRHFAADQVGKQPPLSTKRQQRNPHKQAHNYAATNPRYAFMM